MKNEPVALSSLVNGAVTATVALILFLTNVSGEAAALVLACSAAWTAILNHFIARRNVVPLESIYRQADSQVRHPSR